MSKLFEKHMAALKTGTVGPSFIRGMRAAMHAIDRREQGWSTSTTAPKMDREQIGTLLRRIETNPPRIEAEQSAKGLAWLRGPCVWRKLSDFQRAVIENYSHFTLAGFEDVSQTSARFFVPIYTVHAVKSYLDPNDPRPGKHFSYYVGSWQSGIPFTIVEED